MPDKKRIIDLQAITSLADTDYIMTDNATNGTKKFPLKLLQDTILTEVQALADALETLDVEIDPDDLGLEQDPDTYYVYPTYRGVRSENGIPLASSGGGGGGGGSTNNAILTVTNESGWLSTTVSYGGSCSIELEWSSTEDDIPTGDGTLTITVGGLVKRMATVHQGELALDVGEYLSAGVNKVKIRIADIYDNARTITFTINAVELTISSSFDVSGVFSSGSTIEYTYIPVGALEKTVYFVVDGEIEDLATVTTSGRQQVQSLSPMTHGSHTLLVYFTAEVDSVMVRSNELYYSFIVVDSESIVPIISTPFRSNTATQFETLSIPYTVYTPNSLTSQVTLSANGTQVASLNVDRTEHIWSYRCDSVGTLTLTIASGVITKTIELTVSESSIDVEAETESLSLYLTSSGRSNSELHPEIWGDSTNDISASLTGFNFTSNGWMLDDDGFTVLRVSNDARVTIPYQPFATDFRSTGKTLEFEFATRDIYDYDAVVISCWSNDRGFKLTAQEALLVSEQSNISMHYKEDEHVRVSFVIEKRTENRLMMLYINGIMSGVVQYPDDDNFAQQNPVNISIGNSYCTTDIYNIRVYDNDLTRYQILDNWIADSSSIEDFVNRYEHNNIYDEYGSVVIDSLPSDLPYMVIDAPELPQYKGDKKTVSGYYVDRQDASRSFSFTGCQINVQGTSSAVYDIKNFDMQFKNGFDMTQSEENVANYALSPDVIPFNRFVLKADVASSEGANNVELVKLFCDTDPYKRPEELTNDKVRKGIYGYPIVMFWHNTTTGRTSFYGKMNMNLPKRAPAPYGYSGEMESWEFQNNTSNLMLFLTDYFSQAPRTDPDTGETKATWRYDYEARFPSDEWVNINKLQEFQSFVYSTYRNGATNETLSSPVTYTETYITYDEVVNPETGDTTYEERLVTEDVVYSTDSAAYRLAKFKNEFSKYAEVNSFIFYYIFTELFLMVDSRAKNLFIGFSGGPATGLQYIDRKAVAEPYDMDTAIGIDNEGSLSFGYSLEDTDHLSGGANVFNGQNSVLWCNLRDAFGIEISQMYRTLRSEGTLSYSVVEQRFEEHQSKWPEAIFNEDAWQKYINPLIAPPPGKTATASYLEMAQGSKKEQRKWWLYNRFRYMDSKWTAGDARSNIIELRGYAKANITVTPYADIYPAVRYASYTVTERGEHGVPTTLVCPIDTLNDSEIWIFSAPELASVGDLSGLKVGRADFRAAVNLQSIVVGSAASGYTNQNLTQLYVGNNSLLRTIDARNCTALSGALDFSGATNIEYVYLAGTAVTSVSLPVGGILKTLSLPDTITNLTVRNQAALTSFSMEGGDYSSITTLRIENSGSAIPVLDILDEMTANSRVRIIGFTTTSSSTTDVEEFFTFLDTMQGLDEYGNNLEYPVVSGTITGLGTITGAWLAQMNAWYPDVTIEYEHINSTLNYYSWDGQTLIYSETVSDNGNGVYSGTPTRTSTAQYDYTFIGWSLYQDQDTADSSATQAVGADRNVYAAYSHTTRTYTVTWKNANGTVLETDQNVPYGTTPTYNGATPTQDGEQSTGWNPAVGPISGDTIYTAVYVPRYECIFMNGNTELARGYVLDGEYASYTGNTPVSSVGNYMEFTGWDKPLGPIHKTTVFNAQFRDTRSVVVQYIEGTIQDYTSNTATIIAQGAFYRSPSLKTVRTSATTIQSSSSAQPFAYATSLETVEFTNLDPLSISSNSFVGCNSLESVLIHSSTMPSIANSVFQSTKIESRCGAVYVPSELVDTYKSDSVWSNYNIKSLDEYPITDFSTINDSWSDIVESTSLGIADKYSVGDLKLVNLNSPIGTLYLQVAKSDSTGLTFITREALPSSKRMSVTNNNGRQGTGANGGWEYSEMRTYLNTTVFDALPLELQEGISEVTKYSGNVVPGDTTVTVDGCVTQDKLWLLSEQEAYGTTRRETKGEVYRELFLNNPPGRAKHRFSSAGAMGWWLRTAADNKSYAYMSASKNIMSSSAQSTSQYIAFGFTIGRHITDEEQWIALKQSISNGTLKSKYSIGDSLPLNLGSQGTVNMLVAGFDESSSHVTFIADRCLQDTVSFGDSNWANSTLRSYLNDTVLPLIPTYIRNDIIPVTKYSGVLSSTAVATTDSVWIPSGREVGVGAHTSEMNAITYDELFTSNKSRIRPDQINNSGFTWWLRTQNTTYTSKTIDASGTINSTSSSNKNSIVLGFCL